MLTGFFLSGPGLAAEAPAVRDAKINRQSEGENAERMRDSRAEGARTCYPFSLVYQTGCPRCNRTRRGAAQRCNELSAKDATDWVAIGQIVASLRIRCIEGFAFKMPENPLYRCKFPFIVAGSHPGRINGRIAGGPASSSRFDIPQSAGSMPNSYHS
jgi:hypothetical protein